ncbi:hypothetical protein OBBRIDRAFT_791380 [Obba rivulosa]|uniref:Uncharacterized protein n=1 Tax=Obba rivulosa TaxID=1052685 RepID=A0A8E2B215_9APHY|nr:hypothetical protein OBBRIDRAFT_791380 [Obba rivulosa]
MHAGCPVSCSPFSCLLALGRLLSHPESSLYRSGSHSSPARSVTRRSAAEHAFVYTHGPSETGLKTRKTNSTVALPLS